MQEVGYTAEQPSLKKEDKWGCCYKSTLYKVAAFIGAGIMIMGFIFYLGSQGHATSPFFTSAAKVIEDMARAAGTTSLDLSLVLTIAGFSLFAMCSLSLWYNCCMSKYRGKVNQASSDSSILGPRVVVTTT